MPALYSMFSRALFQTFQSTNKMLMAIQVSLQQQLLPANLVISLSIALLLAYFGGNSVLCDALIQSGAHPGMCNKDSVSLFNFPVATKQLLFRILGGCVYRRCVSILCPTDQIQAEPAWLEGQNCMECKTKFNISTRKHHW